MRVRFAACILFVLVAAVIATSGASRESSSGSFKRSTAYLASSGAFTTLSVARITYLRSSTHAKNTTLKYVPPTTNARNRRRFGPNAQQTYGPEAAEIGNIQSGQTVWTGSGAPNDGIAIIVESSPLAVASAGVVINGVNVGGAVDARRNLKGTSQSSRLTPLSVNAGIRTPLPTRSNRLRISPNVSTCGPYMNPRVDCGYVPPYSCGDMFIQGSITYNTGPPVLTPPILVHAINSNGCLRKSPPCQCRNGPVDPITGALSYEYTDLKLSGPFGLQFRRYYNNQLTFNKGNLGTNWHYSYGEYLDVTTTYQPPPNPPSEVSQIAFYSDEGSPDYFVINGTGWSGKNTYYDMTNGDRLTIINPGASQTYTVTTWNATSYAFDKNGILQSITDRHGNTQTVAYDSFGRLQKVTDVLGRYITFGYSSNSSNQIQSITTYPAVSDGGSAGVQVTFGYTGTDLTSVTEPDGQGQSPKSWTYGYDGNHNLQQVTDPTNAVREVNTYSLNGVDQQDFGFTEYQVTEQYTVEVGTTKYNDVNIAYVPQNSPYSQGSSITDQDGNSSTFIPDGFGQFRTNEVLGPMCDCGGADHVRYQLDGFGRPTTIAYGSSGKIQLVYTYGEDVITVHQDNSTSTVFAEPAITQVERQSYKFNGDIEIPTNVTYGPLNSTTQDLPSQISVPSVWTAVPGASPDPNASPATETLTYDTGGKAELLSDVHSGITSNSANQAVVQNNTTTYTYNAQAQVTSVTGPNPNQQTTISYWQSGQTSDLATLGQTHRITTTVNPAQNGNTTLIWNLAASSQSSPYSTYDIYGNPRSIVDPNGVAYHSSYSLVGQRSSLSEIATINGTVNPTTTYTLDLAQRVLSIKRPLKNSLSFGYDAASRLATMARVNATGEMKEQLALSYTGISQLLLEQAQLCTSTCGSTPTWVTTQQDELGYDALEHLSAVIPTPSPAVFSLTVGNGASNGPCPGDNEGELDSTQDESGQTNFTCFGYDIFERLQSAQGIFGMYDKVSYGYDTRDDITSASVGSLGSSDTHDSAYDDFGRVTAWSSTDTGANGSAGRFTYTYDNAGNRLTMVDAKNNTTTYSYDTLNRPLQLQSSKGSSTETVTLSYDNTVGCSVCLGRLTEMVDPTGSTAYTHDTRGLLLSETRTISGHPYATSATYDANGNRISLTYPSGTTVNYGYDFADRPNSASTSSTTIVSAATYEPFGPIATVKYGNNTERIASYDLRYKPIENELVAIPSGSAIVNFSYQEDLDGDVTANLDDLNTPAPGSPPGTLGPYDKSYSYDHANGNRLLTANGGSSLWGLDSANPDCTTDTYASDNNFSCIPLGSVNETMFTAYGFAGSQIQKYGDGGQTNIAVSYDKNGNESVVGSATYTYSVRNELIAGDGLSYAYDGFGLRTITSQSGTGSRYTFYSPDNHLLEETTVTTGTPAAAYDYIWLGELPVAQVDIGTSTTHWTMSDYLRTPIVQTTTAGAVYWQADYTPGGEIYNNTLRVGSAIHQPLRYPGQEAEQFSTTNSPNGDTGRYYNIFRWYRPHLQRYTQTDPAGMVSQANGLPRVNGVNPYAYAANDPIAIFDKFGLWSITSAVPFIGEYLNIQAGFGWGDNGPFLTAGGGLGPNVGLTLDLLDQGPPLTPRPNSCVQYIASYGIEAQASGTFNVGLAPPINVNIYDFSSGQGAEWDQLRGMNVAGIPYASPASGNGWELGGAGPTSLDPSDYEPKYGFSGNASLDFVGALYLNGVWNDITNKHSDTPCGCQ
jgi:RHS repeat-associated protein